MKKNDFLQEQSFIARQNLQFVENTLRQLSFAQLNFKPAADKWSIAECVEHLNRYSEFYVPAIGKRMEKADKSTNNPEMKYTWFGRFSIKAMHPDNKKKSKTLKRLNPAESKVSPDVLDRFITLQKQLLRLIESAEQYDINKVKVPVDVMRFMRLRLGECLEFLLVHQQRHILQMKELMDS